MPLPHNSATAIVTVDGLGICCFNRRRQFWEIGFLRHHGHQHTLRLTIKDGPSIPPFDPHDRDTVIRIETVNGISPYRDFPDGFFGPDPVGDRTKDLTKMSDDEKENFRWAVNLEDPLDEIKHGRGHLVKPPGFGVTRAFIDDAVFYTERLPETDLFNLALAEDGSTMSDPDLEARVFGKTNELTAADITCASDGAVNIIIDNGHGHSNVAATLPHRPGNPWKIRLTNMPPVFGHSAESGGSEGSHGETPKAAARPERGDFQLYYDVFKLDNPRKQRALWGFVKTDPLESGRTDCNLVWVSDSENLDGLF